MKSLVISAVLCASLLAPRAHAAAAHAAPAAPAFSLPTTHGTVALDSLRGHVALVDFWASWCEPCRHSFPWMADVQKRYADKGLRIVAINLDKDRDAADGFLARFDVPFTVAFDPGGKAAQAFEVKGMPSSYLIDASGHVLLAHIGFDAKRAATLEAAIRQAVGS